MGFAAGLRRLPFRYQRLLYGRPLPEVANAPAPGLHELEPADELAVRQVRAALARAARYWPGEGSCLLRAIAGRLMLARRGVATQLYFGGRREGGDLRLHAWLMRGKAPVCGVREAQGFTVLSGFEWARR